MSLVRSAAWCAILLAMSDVSVFGQEDKGPSEKSPPAPQTKVKQEAGATQKAGSTKEAPAKEKPQEPPAAPPPQATAEQFPELRKQWEDLDTQLNELARQFTTAPSSEEKLVIRGRYAKLVEQSEKLLPQLRSATEAAFAAAPGKDQGATEYMIKFLAYETRAYDAGRQDYEPAYKLARLLIDAKVEQPVLFALAGSAAYQMDDYDNAEKWLTIAKEAKKLDSQATAQLNDIPKRREAWNKEQEIRKKEAEADDLPRVKLETTKGTIVLELFENEAPQTVGNFVSLVEKKFYDGVKFHRVIPGFMAQGGDPQGTGGGGPGYTIYDECSREDHRRHFRGSLSMAKTAEPNSGGSQFFIAYQATTHLDGKHTVFGRVIEGMDVATKLQAPAPPPPGAPVAAPKPAEADKIIKAEVLRKREHDYLPTKVEKKDAAAGGKEKPPAKDEKK